MSNSNNTGPILSNPIYDIGFVWQDMMHITMSFADGSPARISSVNTALRPFRPSFIHIWELKTFWNEKIICEDDIEVRSLLQYSILSSSSTYLAVFFFNFYVGNSM